jgi:PAS domain S-box-containing protein
MMLNSGINALGEVPWGTHFCLLCRTPEDVLEILVPYFAMGLHAGEYCLWVTSRSPNALTAEKALRAAVPDLDKRIRNGQADFVPERDWYLRDGLFDADHVLHEWKEREDQALARGYPGMRAAGMSDWATEEGWSEFAAYEAVVDQALPTRRIVAACPYILPNHAAGDVLDILAAHPLALVRRHGTWERLERGNLDAQDDRLLKLVRDRSHALEQANTSLRQEISNRQKAEDAAHHASTYARNLIEASLDPLVTISPEGKITDVNRATEDATGVPRRGMVGTDFSAYFTEPERARDGYMRVISEGVVRDYPLTIRHISGRTTPVLYNATVYLDEQGTSQGVFAAARDITAQKEVEGRQAVTSALLGLFAHSSSRKDYLDSVVDEIRRWSGCGCVGLRVVDRMQNIPYESYLGFGKDFWKLENVLHLDADDCICIRTLNRGHLPWESRWLSRGGSFHCDDTTAFVNGLTEPQACRYRANCMRFGYQSLAVIPIQHHHETLGVIHLADTAKGKVPYAVVEFIESMAPLIGEAIHRFNAEEAIREQAALLHLAHDAILVRDEDDRVILWNRGAEETYGWTRDEALNKKVGDLLGTEFLCPAKEVDDALARRSQWEGELAHRRHDGARIIVASRWALMRENAGGPATILEIDRDVTEKKALEKEIARHHDHLEELVRQRTEELHKAADDLARSNRDLEQFAYVASHDLQEPLRAVTGFVSLLQRRAGDRIDDTAKEYIAGAVDGVNRMQTLIGDLLTYSRVTKQPPELQITSVRAAVEDALANLRTSIQETNAEVQVDTMPVVLANPSQLTQLVQNLVGNALKFRADAPPRVRISARKEGETWVFSVIDNGIGIDPKYQDRIFLIFQRLHTRTRYPGTGIGLALCKKIVERHGGRIWVESEPGRGSSFFFTLPAREGQTS